MATRVAASHHSPRSKAVWAVLSVAVPFAMLFCFVVLEKEFKAAVPTYGTFWSLWISVAVGLVFLWKSLRWAALVAAVIYIPVMCYVLIFYGLAIAAWYGDYL
jgi:hypothetical protein